MDIQSNYKTDDLKLKNNENQKFLIHFQPMFLFYTPLKTSKVFWCFKGV